MSCHSFQSSPRPCCWRLSIRPCRTACPRRAPEAGWRRSRGLKKRGAEAMGFDQDATTHHFRLAPSGGSIEVTVKNEKDAEVIAAVRSHLRSIAADFARGEFDKPFQTHGEVPPGALPRCKKAVTRSRIATKTWLKAARCG